MRTGCSSRPQSSASGRGRSRNCVSTVPTEPAAAFDAGVVMRGDHIPVRLHGEPPDSPTRVAIIRGADV